jgi:peptidoglycan-associated lipoprotein
VDFGPVRRGEKRTHTYSFTNTGNVHVEIDIVTSCDCTTLEWPEGQVFQPGGSGKITAIFDSTEKEESDTIDIEVILKNRDDEGLPIFYIIQYKYELVQ